MGAIGVPEHECLAISVVVTVWDRELQLKRPLTRPLPARPGRGVMRAESDTVIYGGLLRRTELIHKFLREPL